ncbi:MAG TPA: sugar nucleotide-binding protein, partial [Cyclobacteriaceae bacterium]|nr:sugar nucleotide-binding protein [Cyclobacteriaceae bacterium]
MPGIPIKILVTGAMGQLGGEFKAWTGNPSFHFIFTDLPELDLTDKPAVNSFFDLQKPDFCINCAAYTAVDKAETDR